VARRIVINRITPDKILEKTKVILAALAKASEDNTFSLTSADACNGVFLN
jgi:hypothetical protein